MLYCYNIIINNNNNVVVVTIGKGYLVRCYQVVGSCKLLNNINKTLQKECDAEAPEETLTLILLSVHSPTFVQ